MLLFIITSKPHYMSLTAQRNLGVPIRHAERRAAGRTYENRYSTSQNRKINYPSQPIFLHSNTKCCMSYAERLKMMTVLQ